MGEPSWVHGGSDLRVLPGVPSWPCEPFATEPRRRAGERSSPDPGDSRAEGTVEVERGADQRQVGQRLGKFPCCCPARLICSANRPTWLAWVSIFSDASRASSRRPARASASTYQNEHAEKVPSAPRTPSGLARGLYR